MNAVDEKHRFDTAEAYKTARRRIINNALRRRQQTLDLSGYGLDRVPPEIAQLTTLQGLALDRNRLAALPPEIGKRRISVSQPSQNAMIACCSAGTLG